MEFDSDRNVIQKCVLVDLDYRVNRVDDINAVRIAGDRTVEGWRDDETCASRRTNRKIRDSRSYHQLSHANHRNPPGIVSEDRASGGECQSDLNPNRDSVEVWQT